MRICYKCQKREGSWWDHLCKYCRNRPLSEKEALEYNKTNVLKELITPEEIGSSTSERKYNRLSVIGFILSLVAIFGLGLAGLAGFILGIVSIVQIKHTKEGGKGLAIAAIIIGFIWSFVTGLLKRLIEAGY